MPVVGDTLGSVSPSSQNISWTRDTPFPAIANVVANSANAEVLMVSIQFIGTSTPWFAVEGYSGTSFIINDFAATETLVLTAQDLDKLPNNNYKAVVTFRFSRSEGADRVISVEINLTLSGTFGAQTDKAVYNVVFDRINNELTGETNVNITNNPDAKLLKFWQPIPVFEPKTDFTTGFTLEDNLLQAIATNPNVPLSGTFSHLCKILDSSNNFQSSFEIDMVVFNDSGIVVKPELFAFEVVKNQSEKSAILSILNPLSLNFEIEFPDWISLSVDNGNTNVNITVSTNTGSFNPGTYNGIIKVIFETGITEIPVQLVLKKFVQVDYSETAFCLDFPPINFTRINETGTYVKVVLAATYNVMGQETIVNQTFVIPYINDAAMSDIGKKIHSYFPRYKNPLFHISGAVEFLKNINCDLSFYELDADYKEILTENISSLKFLPGSRPKMFPMFSNYQFRNKRKKSEILVTHSIGDSVIVEKVNPESENINFGDKTIQLYKFPDSFRPVQMQWENSNLVPEWFTFAGDYTIGGEFTHTASKNVLNSLIEKFGTTKVKKLSINTGFILKEELEMLEEMIMNRLVFIKIEDKIYQCYNSTAKLQIKSSTDNVIDRDLEFVIVEK